MEPGRAVALLTIRGGVRRRVEAGRDLGEELLCIGWQTNVLVGLRTPTASILALPPRARASTPITVEALHYTGQCFLREATLKAANTILVDYHHSLRFSRIWGDRSRSSSDGRRFALQRDSLPSSFYPR